MANFIKVTFLAYQEKDPDQRSQNNDDEYQQVLEELDLVDDENESDHPDNTALETGYINVDHIFAMIPYDEGTLIQRPVGSAMYVDEPQEQILEKIDETG